MTSALLNLFSEDKSDDWRKNFSSFQQVKLSDKSLLYRQGYFCHHVYLIIKGVVKLSYLTEQGDEWTVALQSRGDVIGLLIANSARVAMTESAQAIGNVSVIRMEHHEFKEIVTQHPVLLWQVFEAQCLRRQQAERKLLNMLTQSVENRIIEMLKELAELFGKRCAHGFALEIHLTQQELADLIGASRSVVSTVMNDLRHRQLLEYTRELICINDGLFFNVVQKC
ncbi:MAG: Crp/Fnr family transcriptional regulator [Methylococcaceae bacterium]|nr:Crp/Fnr family transcriptional regulator [Methylococcaceae bacterium]